MEMEAATNSTVSEVTVVDAATTFSSRPRLSVNKVEEIGRAPEMKDELSKKRKHKCNPLSFSLLTF